MDHTMEVQGSVFVCDIDEQGAATNVKRGFAGLGEPIEPHEKDEVPRLLVNNFRKNTKPYRLYSIFHKFGTVTYLAVKGQKTVVEFSERAPVEEILKCKFLKIDGSRVNMEILEKFLHCEPNQFEVYLHAELDELDSIFAFERFVKDIIQKAAEESKEEEEKAICRKLEDIMRLTYSECKVYAFGSRVTKLGLVGCDLDIFLDCGNMYNGEFDQDHKEQQLIGEAVLHELVRSADFARTYKVLNARVPIVKFYHSPTGTYGDIAFRNGLGVENTKLVNYLQSLDKRVHPLFLFVKKWANVQGLRKVGEKCHFTSYSLIMMATFYLQQLEEPVLPAIITLMQRHRGAKNVIAGWPCSFTRDKKAVPKSKNPSTLLELTKGFFKYYQYFHFEWKVVCPYLGRSLEREDLEAICDPQSEIASLFPAYEEYLEGGGEPLRTKCAVCVQDPFEHSHNLTRAVKEELLMQFISSCGLIYEKLSSLS